MNMWFIIAQAMGVVTICLEFVSYQIKDKAKYFLTTGIASIFWTLMFVSIGLATGMSTQLSLIVAASFSAIRNIIFFGIFSKDTEKSKKIGRTVLYVMLSIAVVAGVFAVLSAPPEVRWLHTLGAITAVSFVLCQYLPGVHFVRVGVVVYASAVLLTQTPLNILYGDFRWNIMGILIESAKIVSVIVFYVRYIKQPKETRKTDVRFAKP